MKKAHLRLAIAEKDGGGGRRRESEPSGSQEPDGALNTTSRTLPFSLSFVSSVSKCELASFSSTVNYAGGRMGSSCLR